MLIALAKSRSMRGSSHQPAFMSSCLTITHTCFPYLPRGKTLVFYLGDSMLERWERWEDSEVARLERWAGIEVTRWET